MAKVLIVSDTHGNFCNLVEAIKKEKPFDWNKDRLREIAYYKDEIMKATVRRKKV